MHGVESEVMRVRAHIARAETAALERNGDGLAGLTRLQRLVRTLLLEELARYRARGRFPTNRDFADRAMPYFVDGSGTRCAVAHLLEVGGASAIVARIASTRNNAWLHELTDEPELLAWLAAAGLGVGEAAAIQPSYCPSPYSACVCGDETWSPLFRETPVGVLEVTVGSASDVPPAYRRARVDAVYGDGQGILVGAEIAVSTVGDLGSRGLVPLFAGPASTGRDRGASDSGAATDAADAGRPQSLGAHPHYPMVDGILDRCSYYDWFPARHPLDSASVASLWMAGTEECARGLAARDPGWAVDSCTVGASTVEGEHGGCSTPEGRGPLPEATVSILLAVVGVLAARRAHARSPH